MSYEDPLWEERLLQIKVYQKLNEYFAAGSQVFVVIK